MFVLLDDYDETHPVYDLRHPLEQTPGIKTSAPLNAAHALGFLSDDSKRLPCKSKIAKAESSYDFITQHDAEVVVFEGSENVISKQNGFDFSDLDAAAVATLKSCQSVMKRFPDTTKFYRQGGRVPRDGECVDPELQAVIGTLCKTVPSCLQQVGTVSWMGDEAVRRASMMERLDICAIRQDEAVQGSESPPEKKRRLSH